MISQREETTRRKVERIRKIEEFYFELTLLWH